MKNLICYCFGYSAEDVRQDFIRNGCSLIMEKIQAAKRLGGCQCAVKNPQGR
ncbi:MAG: hypothetical protein U5R30_07660 [Deltaproteobacteria bacterium]|nr:hypothetical protein [Deltaproteobacteria bacterium]